MGEDYDALEKLVDKLGMVAVLEILSGICHMKAEHVRTNWQDEALAKVWDRDCDTLVKAAGKVAG